MVIAVYGEWGSGKTSMLQQIRRSLDPEFDKGERHFQARAHGLV